MCVYIKRLRPSTGPGLWIGSLETIFLKPCGAVLGSKLGVLEVQVGGLGGFLGSMFDLVEHKWRLGRFRGYREGVWKGLGWLRGGWGPRSGPNMGPT